MGFDSLDDLPDPTSPSTGARAVVTREQFLALPARQLACGFFTLTLTDGSRKRFRVRLERGKFRTGQRTLSRYCKIGADDVEEREWETIGVVSETGFNLFKRWRNEWEAKWAAIIWALVNGIEVPGYAIEVEARCWLTMRVMKPEDVSVGLCATWRKRFGV